MINLPCNIHVLIPALSAARELLHLGHGFDLDTAGCDCISGMLILATTHGDFLCHTECLILPLVWTIKLLNLFSVSIRDALSEPGCTAHLSYIYNIFRGFLTCKFCAR